MGVVSLTYTYIDKLYTGFVVKIRSINFSVLTKTILYGIFFMGGRVDLVKYCRLSMGRPNKVW